MNDLLIVDIFTIVGFLLCIISLLGLVAISITAWEWLNERRR